jgi:hypothetical protein
MNFDDSILTYGRKLEELNTELNDWVGIYGESEKKRNKIKSIKIEINNLSIESLPYIIKKIIYLINKNDDLGLRCALSSTTLINQINWENLETEFFLDIDKISKTPESLNLLLKVVESKIYTYIFNGICKSGDLEIIKFLDSKDVLFSYFSPLDIMKTSIIFGNTNVIKWIKEKELLTVESYEALFYEYCCNENVSNEIINLIYEYINTIINIDEEITSCFINNDLHCFERLFKYINKETNKVLIKKLCIYSLCEDKYDFLKVILTKLI